MEPESCRGCGETAPAGARFCPSCGMEIGDDMLELPGGGAGLSDEVSADAGWSWGVIVPLGAAVLLIAGLTLLSGDNSDRPGDGASDVSREGTDLGPGGSDSTPTSEPPASNETATTSPRPTATSIPMGAPLADVSELPELDATHLAVRARNQLQFLDLQSGVWTRVGLLSDVVNSYPVSTGLVLELPSRGVAFASVEGGELAYLSEGGGGILGTRGDLVLLWGPGAGGDVQLIDLEGSEVVTINLPGSPWPRGATPDGDVVVQANEWIALVDAITGEHTTVATGNVAGVIGDLILVNHCTEDLECGVDQINARTGERSRVTDEAGFFVPSVGETLRFTTDGTGDTTFFELVDGLLVQTDGGQFDVDPVGRIEARDSSGVIIRLTGEAIVFEAAPGEATADIPLPFPIDDPAIPELTLVGSRGLAS